jgi:hypothetical protein
MSPANGHADRSESCHDIESAPLVTTSCDPAESTTAQTASERTKDLVAELELSFGPR